MLYDQLADRWLISQFCTVADPNNHQLIAISKTADPTGAYYLYDFQMPNKSSTTTRSSVTGGYLRVTAAAGTYSATVAPGTYTATASRPATVRSPQDNLVIANGGAATFSGMPVANPDRQFGAYRSSCRLRMLRLSNSRLTPASGSPSIFRWLTSAQPTRPIWWRRCRPTLA